MPKITAITPQKKKANHFNIFLDGQFAFGLSDYLLLEKNLKIGKVLTAEEITKIVAKDEISKLTDLASRFLSFRPRSEKEVRDYLIKKISKRESINFNQASQSPLVIEVIEKLKKYKYINDLEFAKWWFNSRIRSKPKGLFILKIELKRKGINPEIIEKVTAGSINEVELAKKSLQKKVKKWNKLSPVDFKKKVYAYLLSKGFGFDIIKETFAFFQKKV